MIRRIKLMDKFINNLLYKFRLLYLLWLIINQLK